MTMQQSGHLGAVGHFAMMVAQRDMVGVCITAGGSSALPTFGVEGRQGTNSISIAAPAPREPAVLFDAATSAVALNKIRLTKRLEADLRPGWVADMDGNPIIEELPAPARGEFYGLPIGVTREQHSHKGYGFSLMCEILGSLLSGSVPSMFDSQPYERMFKN